MLKLWSTDNAALVLAREILRSEPCMELQIFLGGIRPAGAINLEDLQVDALKKAQEKHSRVGIIFDVTDDEFLKNMPENVVSFPTELITSFANRGLCDTVEFRRLARKYLRSVKNANCDGVLFGTGILSEEMCRKVLAKTLGTRINALFLSDFISSEWKQKAAQQKIEIFTSGDVDRVKREAENFLHTKLGKGAVKSL